MKKLIASVVLLALAVASFGAAGTLMPIRDEIKPVSTIIKGNDYYSLVTSIPTQIQEQVWLLQQEKGNHIIETDSATYLLVATGEARSGGYTMDVSDVVMVGGTLHVFVTETQPAPGEIVTMILTYPSVLLELTPLAIEEAQKIEVHITTAVREWPDENAFVGNEYAEVVKDAPTEIQQEVERKLHEKGQYIIETDGGTYVLIAAGEKPSGGFTLDVTDVALRGDKLHVSVTETRPGPEEQVTMALTYPYVLLALKTSEFEDVLVDWSEETRPSMKAPIFQSVDYYKLDTYKGFEDKIAELRQESGAHLLKVTEDTTVVFIALGERPTGGYGVEILSVDLYEDDLVVRYSESKPGKEDMVIQVITYPYVIIEVEAVATNTHITKVDSMGPRDAVKVDYEVVTDLDDYADYIESIKEHRTHAIMGDGLLYLGLGMKPTGGYALEIERVEMFGETLIIIVQEIAPGPDDMVSMALTYPHIVIKPDAKFTNVRAASPTGSFMEISFIIDREQQDQEYDLKTPFPSGFRGVIDMIQLMVNQGILMDDLYLLETILGINVESPIYHAIERIMEQTEGEITTLMPWVEAFLSDGADALVPVRQVAEAFGARVAYNAVTKQITISLGDIRIQLAVGSDIMVLNSQSHQMGAKVIIQDSRAFVPLEFIWSMLQ